MELLADIYNILSSIVSANSLNNKIIAFLRVFSSQRDKTWYFLEQWMKLEGELYKKNHAYKYGNLFKRLSKGDFKERIGGERLAKECTEFTHLFDKEDFWNSLLVEEYDNYMGKLKEFFSVNKEDINQQYYTRFACFEEKAKERARKYFGEDDWKKFYLPS